VTEPLAQRLERLRSRLHELQRWRDRARCDLTDWRLDGEPISPGGRWPRSDGVVRFDHPPARVPAGWSLPATRLEIAPGGEGLLRIDYGSAAEAFGVDPWHRRFPLQQREFRLALEAEARLPFGHSNPDPRLEAARLVLTDPELERLHRCLRLVARAAAAVGSDDAALLVAAAERALRSFDWPSETEGYLARAAVAASRPCSSLSATEEPEALPPATRASMHTVQAVLEEGLARHRAQSPPHGRLALVGHAHIDLAWLWPLEETRRKLQRTFHTAAGLLERYPEMTFTHSSAELYELAREIDPDLFARVRELAAAGRWEPAGGMWVEPDLNMTAGESIVRQLLWGQRWFEREMGGRHRVAWLPDCFGFTPALPQLLLGAGIDAFFTTKLNWSETNRFPLDLFWWEGLDGSRVLAHSFDNDAPPESEALGGYNGDPSPPALLAVWRNFRGRLVHPESLFTIGYGDGGGGPSADMLEDVRELAAFPALPEAGFSRVDGYFERLRRSPEAASLPVWTGELYLELHRGTLTTQGRTKRLHRRAERDLVATEVAASLAELLDAGRPATGADLGPAWRLLLRNQFHDILPGSSIAEVYRRARAELSEAVTGADRATTDALQRVAAAVVPAGDAAAALVVNPDLSARQLRLVLAEPLPGAQAVADGWVVTGGDPVAGLEAAVVTAAAEPSFPAAAEGRLLENAFLRVELNGDGQLASVFDKRAGREVLDGPGNQLWVYVDRPRAWDAWDVDADYSAHGEPLGPPECMEVTEPGPHRAGIALRWRHRASTITQTVRLWSNSARLEFATDLDWHDRRLLLKCRFPLAVRSASAAFETAFGVVERPTHRNTTWDQARFEVAGHRFADLSEPGYGVALLNDGRYGYHALGSELGLSLLRSPVSPDPLADEGRHELTYALLPHPGSWLAGGVLTEAEDLNRPLLRLACRASGPARRRALRVEGPPLALAALKPAEDGDGLVLRLYEPQGGRGRARLTLPAGWRASEELNLLEDRVGEPDFEFRPFQVRTHRLVRTD